MLLARISRTLALHRFRQVFHATSCICSELLLIGSSWSPYSCFFVWRVHRSTPLMSSTLLLQQCPACLAHLVWVVFEMGGRCPYRCCFVGCCLQDLFNTVCSILPSSFFYIRLVHPYSSIDTTAAWKKMHFISSDRSDFYMIDSLSMARHGFASHVLMSFSVDEILLSR